MKMDYFNLKWMRWLVMWLAPLLLLLAVSFPYRPPAITPVSAANEGERVQYRPSERVRVVAGIVFARYGKRSLKLDLYMPVKHDGAAPGVIAIRGGGWMVNDRREFAHVASALAERGLVAASIEYRTADETLYPAAIQDVKAAIRWMRANARKYGVSPEAIGVLGGSSGAYMALMAGLTANDRSLEGAGGHQNISSRVQAVVAMAAPTDLRSLDAGARRTLVRILRASPEQNLGLWAQASPAQRVSANGPPVLLLHSDADEAVSPEQSTRFAELYRQAGATAQLTLLPRAPHAFWNYQPWFEQVMEQSAAFFHNIASAAAQQEKG